MESHPSVHMSQGFWHTVGAISCVPGELKAADIIILADNIVIINISVFQTNRVQPHKCQLGSHESRWSPRKVSLYLLTVTTNTTRLYIVTE